MAMTRRSRGPAGGPLTRRENGMTDLYFGPDEPEGRTESPKAWRLPFLGGLVTAGLGIVIVANPGGSLNIVSVLVGVLVLVSGLVHVVQSFLGAPSHRIWSALAGLAGVVIGVVLIRHLHMTLVAMALLLGIVWIVQGVVALLLAGEAPRGRRSWGAVFGALSLAAGIVVLAAPIGSLTALAVLVGLSFIALGAVQVASALIVRRVIQHEHRVPVTRHRSATDRRREVARPRDQTTGGTSGRATTGAGATTRARTATRPRVSSDGHAGTHEADATDPSP